MALRKGSPKRDKTIFAFFFSFWTLTFLAVI